MHVSGFPVFPAPCVSDLLFRESSHSGATLPFFLMPTRIHLSFSRLHSFTIHALHSFIFHASHSSIVHVAAKLHFFMRCILSLFSCIIHSAWSPPDQCSGDHYSCVALIHRSCLSYTLLRPRLVFVFPSMYHIHGLMLPRLFPLLFMYQVEYSAPSLKRHEQMGIRHPTPTYIVVRSLV